MPTTPSSPAQSRLSPENLHTMKKYMATDDPDNSTRPEGEVAAPDLPARGGLQGGGGTPHQAGKAP